jgi:hypothetical protein
VAVDPKRPDTRLAARGSPAQQRTLGWPDLLAALCACVLGLLLGVAAARAQSNDNLVLGPSPTAASSSPSVGMASPNHP